MSLIHLFFQFAQYGLLCFGGGYMIIPLLYADFVMKTSFFTPQEFGNLLSISQMTPGAVSINTATYVGYLEQGIFGGIIASLGLCFPTFVLAATALYTLNKYQKSPLTIGIKKGARWASLVMILQAIEIFSKISIFPENTQIIRTIYNFITFSFDKITLNLIEFSVRVTAAFLSYHNVSFIKIIIASIILGSFMNLLS